MNESKSFDLFIESKPNLTKRIDFKLHYFLFE